MCLQIIVQISENAKARVGARRLSKLTGLHVSKVRDSDGPALHFSVTGGCSCEFLSRDAEFESQIWNLEKEHLAKLVEAVKTIGKESKKFTFLAQWLDGEPVKGEQKTKLKELVKDLRENRVKNGFLYNIS